MNFFLAERPCLGTVDQFVVDQFATDPKNKIVSVAKGKGWQKNP